MITPAEALARIIARSLSGISVNLFHHPMCQDRTSAQGKSSGDRQEHNPSVRISQCAIAI
jgi:hypothetical protein